MAGPVKNYVEKYKQTSGDFDMNERQVMEYMEQAGRYGISPGLGSIRELCRRLGDPQKQLKFVHVAGTNGKGSVSAYLASALKEAGYRTGRYLSPTLFDYRERIQVNGRYITKKALCEGIGQIRHICDEMTEAGLPHPTPFEIETALAFLYFRDQACRIVVLETGMGGELDATNLVESTVVSVLTSISMDHMKFLGNTLREIARQKAGILKQGRPAVSAWQQAEAFKEIAVRAEELNCSLLHELTHCRRRDIWLKTLAMWVNALHWFNPLAWYMVRAVERDTELACDEDVLRRLPAEQRAAYGRTILSAVERLSNGRHGPTCEM